MESFFPEEVIEEVKNKNDIVDVVSQYLQLKSMGTSHKALCPFHQEKTPSFIVNREKQVYKCFGCGEGGDVIKFIMTIENLTFTQALKMLAQRVNIYIDETVSFDKIKKKKEKQNLYYEVNKLAARYFYNNLTQKKNPALDYLLKRGLSVKTIKSFGLGYALNSWNDLLNYLQNKGYIQDDIEKCGLIIRSKQNNSYYDRFRNRIMFPIFDITGNIIAFGARALDDTLPKYLNSPDTEYFNKSEILYGLNIARKNSKNHKVILVEGYMDVIMLHQQGFQNVVATLGTSLTKTHANILKKYFNEIILCFDGDEAGKKATLRSIEILQNIHENIKVILLPVGVDPDDYIIKEGKQAFQKKIDEALNFIDYKIYLAQQKYNSDKIEDQVKLAKEVVNIIKEIKSPVEQEIYLKKVEEKIGISKDAIAREIYGRKIISGTGNNTKYSYNFKRNNKYIETVPLVERKGHIIAAKQLIKYMLTNVDFISNIIDKIEIDDFIIESHQNIFKYICENKENIDALSKIEEYLPDLNKEIKDILNIDIQQIQIDKVVEKYKKDVKRYKLLYERNILKERQKEIMKMENIDKEEVEKQLLKIGTEMMKINLQIQKLQSEERREQN